MTPPPIDEIFKNGMAHHNAGRWVEAQRAYEQILASQPNHLGALHMRGMLLGQLGQSVQAVEVIRRVIQLQPDAFNAHNNLASALRNLGQLDEALIHLSKAVELRPDFAAGFTNMGNIYMEQGRQDRALECFRRAVALKPHAPELHSNLLYALHFSPEYDAPTLLAEHRGWAARHERPVAQLNRRHENSRDPDRRLKIGYVSADFHSHAVGRFLLALFAHHNHRQFEICCYADLMATDPITQRLHANADCWQLTMGLSNAQLAEKICDDRIDILIDLAQHSGDNRLPVFARKPAPIQVSWLGYPSTTGLDSIDYRLTDPYLDEPGRGDENYSERSIRLPHCFWCYEPLENAPNVNALPAARAGYVTFGCMNRFDKVTTSTLMLWRQILQAVPKSRLLIHSKIGDHLESVRRLFEEGGIAPRRLEFVEHKPVRDYIHEYHRIDVALDPFPHGGGTVTCDALWMGVPVVTLCGRTAVGRGGVSLLRNVGVPELIAHTPEEYISIATSLARNPAGLVELRATLRQRMKSSPLLDGKRFAADMEAAYRQMWQTWCSARGPM